MQAGGGPQIDFLAVVADGGIDDAEVDKIVGGQAALLAQLALGGLKRVLVRFELAGGQLPDLLAEGVVVPSSSCTLSTVTRMTRPLKISLLSSMVSVCAIVFLLCRKGPAVQAGPILLLFYSRRRQ